MNKNFRYPPKVHLETCLNSIQSHHLPSNPITNRSCFW